MKNAIIMGSFVVAKSTIYFTHKNNIFIEVLKNDFLFVKMHLIMIEKKLKNLFSFKYVHSNSFNQNIQGMF